MNATRPLTGKKVLAIAITAFGIVIAANMAMLIAATGTFPGLVVQNSYVASQKWQAEADAQNALGWEVEFALDDGELAFLPASREGTPVRGLDLIAIVGRPTTTVEDQTIDLVPTEAGYAAPISLAPGAWRVEITTRSGPAFRIGADLTIAEPG